MPLRAVTDPAHGGRWTSLSAGGREWLWRRDEPRRPGVRPGDAFADAGGLEECVPTVRGTPDHGDAWSRPWRRDGDEEAVDCPDFRLARRLRTEDAGLRLVADYRLTARPGYRFVWAAHALLAAGPQAWLELPEGAAVRRYPDGGARWTPGEWPTADGVRLDRLGPDDGTAVGAVVDAARAAVHDGRDTLRFALEVTSQQCDTVASDGVARRRGVGDAVAGDRVVGDGVVVDPVAGDRGGSDAVVGDAVAGDRGGSDGVANDRVADDRGGSDAVAGDRGPSDGVAQPVSVALWRNLGGFPEDAPYRSIGVEPMLGRVFGLAAAGEHDAARVPLSGELCWRLTVTAERRTE